MHAYESFRRHGGPSATPIFDALCAEYVRAFRSLPGDRSGEEDLEFTAFGTMSRGPGAYSAYSAGSHSARLGQPSPWQRVGYLAPHAPGARHVPAALPPAPRRGI
ncbi:MULTISPECIES: hypothetical protein [unclassified Streptomyces]|uniref:hypothetical protein n=1 Tax=unclassified Streptomyces TaxID=2593676 RepID=UPI00136AF0A1|nr:hypothetical protein [Streptomyces sp. SHP 1-2]MCW5251072.1 hypothetical protein [Streptomyces sp. SHP 1-2]MYU22745.1 hypothetical protein [Streptomyces sp. SID8352]